jgi:UDPglucose--hexose-1-phosphate uridylyltransferase
MTIRRNLITGDPVVFAPERAGRPNAFAPESESVAGCPFCPGNEAETPPEIARAGEPWNVRVFPNKYPALAHHEVIVEARAHDATFDRLEHAADVVGMYASRYRALSRFGLPVVFKNHGRAAGVSIAHLHSQIAALPFTPPRVARETHAFANAHRCPLCHGEKLVVAENETFVSFAPYGSNFAYQQWLVPRRHTADFGDLTEQELSDLAALLQQAARAMQSISPAHNWLVMSFPGTAGAHMYVDAFPRLTNIAGFELATGTYIDVIDPEAAARRMTDACSR